MYAFINLYWFVWCGRDENKQKEAGIGPFLKKSKSKPTWRIAIGSMSSCQGLWRELTVQTNERVNVHQIWNTFHIKRSREKCLINQIWIPENRTEASKITFQLNQKELDLKDCSSQCWPTHSDYSASVWPDLAKFRHVGTMLKHFGHFEIVLQVFLKDWQIGTAVGKF